PPLTGRGGDTGVSGGVRAMLADCCRAIARISADRQRSAGSDSEGEGSVTQSTNAVAARRLAVTIEPEVQLLAGGLQPFLFRSAAGTLVVQAQWPSPAGYRLPPKNVYPGLPGTAVSRDGGAGWELWHPAEGQGLGPIFEGAAVQLRDGTVRVFDW